MEEHISWTPQTYGLVKEKKYKKYKKDNRKKTKKQKYYLRKSNKKKPYLNQEKHVRKYKPERTYQNKLQCFVCNSNDHLARMCPKRQNFYDTKSTLIECTNEDLIQLDEYISDTETIYSIITIEDTILEHIEDSDNEFINEFEPSKLRLNIESDFDYSELDILTND